MIYLKNKMCPKDSLLCLLHIYWLKTMHIMCYFEEIKYFNYQIVKLSIIDFLFYNNNFK